MSFKLIDLTQEIYNGMPVYPGHQRTAIFQVKTHEETKLQNKTEHTSTTMGVLFCDHGPTHVDAINHIDPSLNAPSIDKIPLDWFYTPGICLDVSRVKLDEYITADILEEAYRKSGLEIKPRSALLVYTGHYNRNYNDPTKWLYEYTGLDRSGMEWAADRGVINVGIDAPSIDSCIEMKARNYPAHRVCRERQIINTENLANLDQVAGKAFTFICLPLIIRGGTGSPVRAIAVVEE
jgi:kynurenine formamidase